MCFVDRHLIGQLEEAHRYRPEALRTDHGQTPSKHIILPMPDATFFLSAFAALGDPASRAYYDKKIAQGKHHT